MIFRRNKKDPDTFWQKNSPLPRAMNIILNKLWDNNVKQVTQWATNAHLGAKEGFFGTHGQVTLKWKV